MDALQNLLDGENGSAIQLVLITLFLVIGLILLVWIFRRIAGSPSRRAARNRVPRLSITDSAAVDDKRYLVLVRRDNVEHLVLIGGPTDVVVESGIVRVQPAVQTKGTEAKPAPEAATTQAPQEDPSIAVPAAATAATLATTATATAETLKAEPEASVEIEEPVEIATEQTEAAIEVEEIAVETPDVSPQDIQEAVASIEIDTQDIETEPLHDAIESPVAEEPAAEAVETDPVELAQEANLEEAITAQLDDALSSEEFAVDAASATEQSTDAPGDSEDDMQRLLDELAGETKEPA